MEADGAHLGPLPLLHIVAEPGNERPLVRNEDDAVVLVVALLKVVDVSIIDVNTNYNLNC